jgi:single-stranded-DNA-specific exonuclease
VREEALAQAEARGLDGPLVWAAAEGWHPGVVGIVAARLKEAANRPSVVIGFEGDDGKGSARSVPGVDLGAAIQRLAAEGMILKGGGHKMAAGLTLTRSQLEPAMDRLAELLARQGAGGSDPHDLRIDSLLTTGAATVALVEEIENAGPFGAAAPAPRFAFANVAGQCAPDRRKPSETDPDGRRRPRAGRHRFGAFDGPLGPALETPGHRRFHVAGKLELNHWNGRTRVQLRLDDAAST